ncbi:hypothetical protein D9M73_103990 [compost metagenome]
MYGCLFRPTERPVLFDSIIHSRQRGRLNGRFGHGDLLGQASHISDAILRKQYTALDDVTQFAHIPRPRVGLEPVHCVLGEAGRLAGVTICYARIEIVDETFEIAGPQPKRRHFDRRDAQAMIEIKAKAPGGHLRAQVTICHGQDTNIYPPRSVVPHPVDYAFLKHP